MTPSAARGRVVGTMFRDDDPRTRAGLEKLLARLAPPAMVDARLGEARRQARVYRYLGGTIVEWHRGDRVAILNINTTGEMTIPGAGLTFDCDREGDVDAVVRILIEAGLGMEGA